MKRLVKGLLVGLSGLVTLAGAGVGYLYAALPAATPVKDVRVEATPERLSRGQYLVNHVAGCTDCHSTRDWSRYAAPVIPGTEGKGGERFDRSMGIPGTLYAANITPAGIGRYSDGELIRAVTTGVTREGRPLFPLMPWQNYGHLCDSDLEAVVAYVRSLAPVANPTPESKLDFPVNLLVRTMPSPAEPWACPDSTDDVAKGRYLTTMAGCADCHTPMEKGAPVPGKTFAGGSPFAVPTGGVVRASNITPDPETGIGSWTKEAFVARFAAMRSASATPAVRPGDFQTVMPWTAFAGMTDEDIGAIYAYLRTQAPVSNRVERFTAR